MTKDLIDQLPADEQPMASILISLAGDMQLPPAFQWNLETQLMEKAKTKTHPWQGWTTRLLPALGWAAIAAGLVFLLSWTVRSLAPNVPPAAGETSIPAIPFETGVRQGELCAGPLALAHGFDVFLTNPDKTGFLPLDPEKSIGELRSLAWSPDGERLALLGNTTGRGNIHFTGPAGGEIEDLLSPSELGYLIDVAWSRDGTRLITWTGQNTRAVILLGTDGTPPTEIRLGAQVLGTPRFTPDGEHIVFYGADTSTSGLFEASLQDGSQTRLINPLVEDESGYAWSSDGSRLAYFEMDRELGEARLVAEDMAAGERTVLATIPIPRGAGSSIPESTNLSWSSNGEFLVFEFGGGGVNRAVHLAYSDGGLVKLADAAHAPAISADGTCLAYIREDQVFLLDLTGISTASTIPTPLLLADLPAGRGRSDSRLDKLQWQP